MVSCRSAGFASKQFLDKYMSKLGARVALTPLTSITFAVVLAMFCAIGIIRFETESRTEKLWVPAGSRANDDLAFVRRAWGSGIRQAELLFAAETTLPSGVSRRDDPTWEELDVARDNIIAADVLGIAADLVQATDEVVITLTESEQDLIKDNRIAYGHLSADATQITLRDICIPAGPPRPFARLDEVCQLTGPLRAWAWNKTAAVTDPTPVQTLNDYYASRDLAEWDVARQIGGLTRDSSGSLTNVRSARFVFLFRNSEVDIGNDLEDPISEAWEGAWIEKMQELGAIGNDIDSGDRQQAAKVLVIPSSTRARSDEFGRAIGGDVTLLSAGYGLIIFYVALVLGGNASKATVGICPCRSCAGCCTNSRVFLALMGVLSVGLAIIAAIGVSSLIGIPWGPVNSVLPFVLIGIGVDDVFIFVNTMQTEVRRGVQAGRSGRPLLRQALTDTYRDAGVSITVTSFTDILAFAVGAITVLPALSGFSLYAAIAIVFVFVNILFFFGPIMMLDFERQLKQRADCCFVCIPCEVSEQEAEEVTLDEESLEEDAIAEVEHAGVVGRFLGTRYTTFITHKAVRASIIVVAVVLVGVSIAGATQLKQDFNFRSFVPGDSWLQTYFDYSDWYFGRVGSSVDIVSVGANIDHFVEQEKIRASFDAAQAHSFAQPNSLESWLHEYDSWLVANNSTVLATQRPEWNRLLREFLASPQGATFTREVLFKDSEGGGETDANGIFATRATVRIEFLESTVKQVESMQGLRDEIEAKSGDLDDVFPFSFDYPFREQYAVIEREAAQNISIILVVAGIIVLLLVGHFGLGLIVFVLLVGTVVDILGLMFVWGVDIDGVSVTNLVIGVGLAVDYSAHIAVAFGSSVGDRIRRVRIALATMGSSVLNGAISTFLAVLVLAFSKSFIFTVFFKQFFGIVIFGVWHGLIVLPAVLSLVGPLVSAPASETDKPPSSKSHSTHSEELSSADIDPKKTTTVSSSEDTKEELTSVSSTEEDLASATSSE